MLCPRCGTPNPDTERFCTSCGTRLAEACDECPFYTQSGATYCGACGSILSSRQESPSPLPRRRAHFATRKGHPDHSTKLARSLNETQRQFQRLFACAFGHHIVDYGPVPQPLNTFNFNIYQWDRKVRYLFHRTKFQDPIITRGPRDGPTVRLSTFISEITENPIHTATSKTKYGLGPSNFSVLIGRTGIGKTTLYSHIIVSYRAHFENNKIWPIRVDVEQIAGQDIDRLHFYKSLYILLAEQAEVHLPIAPATMRETAAAFAPDIEAIHRSKSAEDEYIRAISELVIFIYNTTGWRLFLYLDNIDRYYYLFDRISFFPQGDALRDKACRDLAKLLDGFISRTSPLGQIGACVLVSMRRYTLNYLRARRFPRPKENHAIDRHDKAYRLKEADVSDVIRSRSSLLKDIIGMMSQPGKQKAFYEAFSNICDNLLDDSSRTIIRDKMFRHSYELSHHGHRTVIDHISELNWGADNSEISERFFMHYAPILLSFMTDNYARYTQGQLHFPNMFLTRGDLSNDPSIPPQVAVHEHTYWLKYLVANYIYQKQSANLKISKDEVIFIFSPTEGGYELELVRLVLGALSQVDLANVIEPVYEPGHNKDILIIKDIRITDRGKLLMNGFALSFLYLQLIVEDELLEIPQILKKDFDYIDHNYQYLVGDAEEYWEGTRFMVLEKARQVFMLLEVLDVALEYEKRRYPAVFSQLAATDVELPDVSASKQSVYEQCKAILNKYKSYSDDLKMVESYRNAAICRRKEIEQHFANAYLGG